jgi:hypothetical protein
MGVPRKRSYIELKQSRATGSRPCSRRRWCTPGAAVRGLRAERWIADGPARIARRSLRPPAPFSSRAPRIVGLPNVSVVLIDHPCEADPAMSLAAMAGEFQHRQLPLQLAQSDCPVVAHPAHFLDAVVPQSVDEPSVH